MQMQCPCGAALEAPDEDATQFMRVADRVLPWIVALCLPLIAAGLVSLFIGKS